MRVVEGERIGNYEITRACGSGLAPAVYEARHVATKERFAIRVFPEKFPNAKAAVNSLLRVARRAHKIGGDDIVDVLDTGETSAGQPVLVMEHVDDPSVVTVLETQGPFDDARAIKAVRKLCKTLARLHREGVVHGAISPDRLFLVPAEQGDRLKIGGFGLAKLGIHGPYRAPEQKGDTQPDARADVFAMGCLLYHVLTGTAPFDCKESDHSKEPTPLSEQCAVSEDVELVIERALSRDPADRFDTLATMHEALEECGEAERSAILPLSDMEAAIAAEAAEPMPGQELAEEKRSMGARAMGPLVLLAATVVALALGVLVYVFSDGTSTSGSDGAPDAVSQKAGEPAPPPAALQHCEAGKAREKASQSQCCWPGQSWTGSECHGEPSCPAGWQTRETGCERVAPAKTWVQVEAGTYEMGSPSDELGRSMVESRHGVTISKSFLISSTEVTYAEFEKVLGYEPPRNPRCPDSCPVEGVSWHEAAAYCNGMSKKQGLGQCYHCEGEGTDVRCDLSPDVTAPNNCAGYRLPTEAEWETAARAGTQTATHEGNLDDTTMGCEQPNKALDEVARFCGNTKQGPKPVAGLAPNKLGLYDMLGNVAEWCHDWYGPYPDGATTDPFGPPVGSSRVIRGGGWSGQAIYSRAASRRRSVPGATTEVVGIRPCRTVTEGDAP